MSAPRKHQYQQPAQTTAPVLRRHKPNYLLPVLSLVLLSLGLIVIFTIGPGLAAQRGVSENYFVYKQFLAMALGFIAFFSVSHMPFQLWKQSVPYVAGMAILGSLAVLVFGDEINGATRWLSIGGFSFQAAELVKFAYLLWLARLLSDPAAVQPHNELATLKKVVLSLGTIGFVVAGLQSDLGSTAVMVAMTGGILFISGIKMRRLLVLAGIVAVGVVIAIASTPYRRDRLMTFMNPESDCLGAGYQACQALIAVGSGGVFGKGIQHSVQAYGYLPFAENDSIFAIYAEKFGFLGTTFFIFLYGLLLAQILRVARKAPDSFSRLVVIGVFMWLGSQALINVGAMVGLLPLKGITLPFVSYGGTSLIFVLTALGIVFHISRYTKRYSVNEAQEATSGYTAERRRFRGAHHSTNRSRA